METYRRPPILFVAGHDATVIDDAGNEYLDFLAGIAVISLGHADPEVADAVAKQARTLVHVSNLFWTQPGITLSRKMNTISGGGFKVFFANSGTEAIECAIKLTRKAAGPDRSTIVCAENSFHGRTLAALAATGQPKKWKGFEPIPEGFCHAIFNDLSSFEKCITERTAAVLIEPIQGEGGVVPATDEFLHGLRDLCSARGVLFILDEIQTGCGRTGEWWAWQDYKVRPDIFVAAKGLANGFPIGACIAREEVAAQFQVGDHGSTFGGGPIAATAALRTLELLEERGFREFAREKGALLRSGLETIPHAQHVRGKGLLSAIQFDAAIGEDVARQALQDGLIVNSVRPDTLRIAPPLCVTKAEIAHGVEILRSSVTKVLGV